ncbi:exported hypothetical protein [Candidatus Sulfopaludibacter sp. SbA3]|nr:exported hypothetical protein [Candidatus Sulfopaludibacter sp. SbA3]
MRKLTLLATIMVLFAGAVCAQIPDTPPGRQLTGWLSAINGHSTRAPTHRLAQRHQRRGPRGDAAVSSGPHVVGHHRAGSGHPEPVRRI